MNKSPIAVVCGKGTALGGLGFIMSSEHLQILLALCDLSCETGTMMPIPDLTNSQS